MKSAVREVCKTFVMSGKESTSNTGLKALVFFLVNLVPAGI